MTAQQYALVDASGSVDNVVMWDGSPDWTPPAGYTAVQSNTAAIGWTYAGGVFSPPAALAMTLVQAQAAQIAALQSAYEAAITAPVSYTTVGGATATFTQSATNTQNLQNALVASAKSQAWPLNLWLNSSGQPVTPFTYADLQGLAAAMEAADTPGYMDLLTKVAAVNAATTVAAVQSVTF